MTTIKEIFPEYIRLDGDTQPRAKIDQAVCDEYGERMKAGEKFPPIDVFFDGTDHWLADGFHRIQAYMMAVPGKAIECNVYEGTQQDAQWHSYSVNRTHGLRRTNEDKELAVRAALTHPKGLDLSDRQLAEYVGVSPSTIAKYREQLSLGSGVQIGHLTKRTGRDGKRYSTHKRPTGGKRQSKNGKRPSQAFPPRSPAEYAKAKRAGRKLRQPDTMVKLELPNNNSTNCAYDLLRYFTFKYLQKVFTEVVRLNQERETKEKTS